MAKTVGYANAFVAGEIGPDARERSDLQQHAKGLEEGLNMIGLVTGPSASRGGMWDVAAQMSQAAGSRLRPFVRSSDDALLLEFGHLKMRVMLPDGTPVLADGEPYELATPWTSAMLPDLWFRQVGDVLYVTDVKGRRTKALSRLADVQWVVTDYAFREGPWLPEDVASGVTLTASAVEGINVTLTASAASFLPGHVGARVRIRQGDGNSGHATWTADTEYDGGTKVQFDGRIYRRTDGGPNKSGSTPPLHSEGTVSDGKLSWLFLHDGAGVALITGYVSETQVTATIERALPSTDPTKWWSLQAYSDVQGWPRALAEEREERLIFGGGLRQPGRVDATRSFGFGPTYGDFKPGLGNGRVVDDDAVALTVGGAARVVWLTSATMLLAGCTDGVHVVSGQTWDDPMTPGGRRARRILKQGCADVEPLIIEGPPPVVLYVVRGKRVLRDLRAAADLTVESRNAIVLANHVGDRGIEELAWQDEPDNLIWMRLSDGGLAAMTYHLEHQVFGVTRQPLPEGWTVDSLASVPTPADGDRLFLAVSRPIAGGGRQRRIWRLAPRREEMFLDGARRYLGAPETTITGLDHLDGDEVAVVADGARLPDMVVADGQITLPTAASKVDVGLKALRRFKTLPLDLEGAGSTQARTVRANHATVIVTGVDFRFGDGAPQGMARHLDREPARQDAPRARRQRVRHGIGAGVGRDFALTVESDAPFDLVVHAWRLEAEATP